MKIIKLLTQLDLLLKQIIAN